VKSCGRDVQVNNHEMVSLVREPHNRYDANAVKVSNVSGVQVGHIKRELAKPLASIVDRRLARVEGSVLQYIPIRCRCFFIVRFLVFF